MTAHFRPPVIGSLAAAILLAACATHPRKPPVPELAGNPAQPDCRAADYQPGKPLTTIRPEEGCWNEANLALMVADPADLVHGKPLGPANGRRETLGVEAYQDGKLKTLVGQETSSPTVLGVSSAGGTP